MATHRFLRFWPLLLVIFLAGTLNMGCKGCKDADDDALEAQDEDPWKSTLDVLADHVPADATHALFIVDFTTALAAYPGLRARVSTYMKDFSTIEADLRNTLGVDPAHPSNLSELGVEPTGGAFCTKLQDQPLCGVTLSDPSAFEEHMITVLQGQPFNLRAPIVETELPSGGRLLRFASEENGPVKAAVVLTDALGYVVLQPRADDIEGLAANLETPNATPLRTRPAFQKLLEHTEPSAIMGWLGPDAITDLGGELFDTDLERMIPQKNLSEGALLGIKIYADAIQGWFSVAIDENNNKLHTLLARSEDHQAADFSKFVDDDAYAFVRLHVDPDEIRKTLRATLDDENIEVTQQHLEEKLGDIDIEDALLNALGTDLIVMATRARLLTLAGLARGGEVNARALGDGLGLILAYQLRDADTLRTLLNEVSNSHKDILSHVKNDDEEYWEVQKGPSKGTLLILTEDAVIATTSRQKSDVLKRIAADDIPPLKEVDADEARTLRGETDSLGLFVDLKRVANNSIGRIASNNLSDSMRNAIQIFDEFWAHGELEDDQWFDGRYRIQLSTPNRR